MAQTGTRGINGTVVDAAGRPLALANVVLRQVVDSAFVSGTTTASDGTFSLTLQGATALLPQARDERVTTSDNVTSITQFLRISLLGYETKDIPLPTDATNLGRIVLSEDANLLGEAVVSAHLPQTQLKNGAMVTNIAGTILERAGTAEQTLNRLPSVLAKDGKVEVLGHGTPIIYINGRRMREEGELTRLSSSDIKSVEVIANPGARYEASTTSVIRITTKPRVGDGFSLYSQSWMAREESGLWRGLESLTMNYRWRGLDVGGSLYYNQFSRRDDSDVCDYTFLDKSYRVLQTLRQRYNTKDFFAKLRTSYAFDEANSVGISFSYDRYPEMYCYGGLDGEVYTDEVLSESVVSLYDSDERRTNWNGNAYYVGKIGNVSIDFNTDWYYGTSDEWMHTTEQVRGGGLQAADELNNLTTQQLNNSEDVSTATTKRNRLIASKLVLSTPLFGGELSFGGEYSYSQRRTCYNVLPKDILDDDNSRIKEGMTSAFLDYRRTFGKLSLNAGLRYEYVDFDYYENDVRVAEQSKTYSNFFPSLSLTMPVGRMQMMLTYASSVSRPSYWLLRSNTTYGNRYTYETGNPFLVPQVRTNLEYTFSYKWLTYTAMYSHMKHPLMLWGELYKNQPSTLFLSYTNGASYDLAYTQVSFSPTIGKWHPMLSLGIMKQWTNLPSTNGHSMNNPQATFRFNNTLETSLCDITLSMVAQTEGGDMNEYFCDGYFNADLSLSRSFLKKKLSLQLDIYDIFHSAERTLRECFGSLQASDMRNLHQQLIALTVRYNLNTTRSKYRGTGAGQSQKSRM